MLPQQKDDRKPAAAVKRNDPRSDGALAAFSSSASPSNQPQNHGSDGTAAAAAATGVSIAAAAAAARTKEEDRYKSIMAIVAGRGLQHAQSQQSHQHQQQVDRRTAVLSAKNKQKYDNNSGARRKVQTQTGNSTTATAWNGNHQQLKRKSLASTSSSTTPTTTTLEMMEESINKRNNNNNSNNTGNKNTYSTARDRPGFAARTLEQLQKVTQQRYKQTQQQQQQQLRRPTTTTNGAPRRPSVEEDKSLTRMFTLYFNEASVQAVGHWVKGNCCDGNLENNNNNNPGSSENEWTTIPTTVVDARFRLCGACYLYGHYEVECPSLTRAWTLRLAKDLRDVTTTTSTTNIHSTVVRAPTTQPPLQLQQHQHQPHKQSVLPGPEKNTKDMQDNNNNNNNNKNDKESKKGYDIAVEYCEGYLIEQRAAPELDVTEVDAGVFIQAASSVEAFARVSQSSTCGADPAVPRTPPLRDEFKYGDLVAWSLPATPQRTEEDGNLAPIACDVCLGMVEMAETTSDKVLIKVINTIPREPGAESSKFPRDVGPPVDSLVWVTRDAVYLVVEPTRWLQIERTTLVGKRKTDGTDDDDNNRMRVPRTIRQRKDGTFVRPAGRTPAGHRWDAAQGYWVLETAS